MIDDDSVTMTHLFWRFWLERDQQSRIIYWGRGTIRNVSQAKMAAKSFRVIRLPNWLTGNSPKQEGT